MSAPRLSTLDDLPDHVARPLYDRAAHGVGIVHIGVGAFHRAHQAVYTDAALAAEGGDWRIAGVSLRSTAVADALNPQDGLYTLLTRGPEGVSARVVGALSRVVTPREPGAALAAMADPATRIVSLTVTEKAYGVDRAAGAVAEDHPAVAHDLSAPREPQGVLGLIVEALRLRREAGLHPFTALCCDNLPENGELLRAGVLDFARRVDPALRDWIAEEVAFPATMVDRITPASTDETLAEAERLVGRADHAAIETEPFSQWVIEDRFCAGRPAWEAGGAIFVSDVAPYERMKLRMLNGAHSLIAYVGVLTGRRYVRDVMADPELARLVRRHMAAAAGTLDPVEAVDLVAYADALAERFANPAIAHETRQIAMDGTEKLPQRLLAPALDAIERGLDPRPFAFAVAAWMRYALGRKDDGSTYSLNDPREARIGAALAKAGGSAEQISAALHELSDVFPERLARHEAWRAQVRDALGAFLDRGCEAAVAAEARTAGAAG